MPTDEVENDGLLFVQHLLNLNGSQRCIYEALSFKLCFAVKMWMKQRGSADKYAVETWVGKMKIRAEAARVNISQVTGCSEM